MNKYFLSSLILAGALTIGSLNAQTFGGGDGLTKATAWEIYTKAHLQELSDFIIQTVFAGVNGTEWKHFRLMNDITDSVDFVIGDGMSARDDLFFMGSFHGGGHKITLAINPSLPLLNVALFSGLRKGSIDSLEVDGYVIKNYSNQNSQVAGIVAQFYNPAFAINSASLTNSINNATIISNTLSYAVAGIAAVTNRGTIFNCKNNNTVTGNANYLGGISATISNNSTISQCINNGSLENTSGGANSKAGGIIAKIFMGNVLNCLNLGVVKGNNRVGGIVGDMNALTTNIISENINHGFTKGTSNVGGILGFMNGGMVSNNSNFSVVEGDSNVGCIVGLKNGGTVINNHYDTQMCGEED